MTSLSAAMLFCSSLPWLCGIAAGGPGEGGGGGAVLPPPKTLLNRAFRLCQAALCSASNYCSLEGGLGAGATIAGAVVPDHFGNKILRARMLGQGCGPCL